MNKKNKGYFQEPGDLTLRLHLQEYCDAFGGNTSKKKRKNIFLMNSHIQQSHIKYPSKPKGQKKTKRQDPSKKLERQRGEKVPEPRRPPKDSFGTSFRAIHSFVTGEESANNASTRLGETLGIDTNTYSLRPHQLRGLYSILYNLSTHSAGGVLAHEMGLGKSLQAIAISSLSLLISESGKNGQGANVLFAVPASVISQWVQYWSDYIKPNFHRIPIKVHTYNTNSQKRAAEASLQTKSEHTILIASHQSVVCSLNRCLQESEWTPPLDDSVPDKKSRVDLMFSRIYTRPKKPPPSGRHSWDSFVSEWENPESAMIQSYTLVVIDEVHCARNPGTQMFGAMCLIKAQVKLGLTGTPLVNEVTDLVALGHLTQILTSFEKLNSPSAWKRHPMLHSGHVKKWMSVERQRGNLDKELPVVSMVEVSIPMDKKSSECYEYHLDVAKEVLERMKSTSKTKNKEEDGERTVHGKSEKIIGGSKKQIENRTRFKLHSKAIAILNVLRHVAALGECGSPITEGKKTNDLKQNGSRALARSIYHGMEMGRKVNHTWNTMKEILYSDRKRKIIFFSMWTEVLEVFQHKYEKFLSTAEGSSFGKACVLTGNMSREERHANVNRFQKDSLSRVIFITLTAGGTGINLTQASDVFFFEPYWNFALMHQGISRTVRFGCAHRAVQVRFFISRDTVEEVILQEVAKSKHDMAKYHINGEGEETNKKRLSFERLGQMIRDSVKRREFSKIRMRSAQIYKEQGKQQEYKKLWELEHKIVEKPIEGIACGGTDEE